MGHDVLNPTGGTEEPGGQGVDGRRRAAATFLSIRSVSIGWIAQAAESSMTPDCLLAELRAVREAVAMEGAAILAGW